MADYAQLCQDAFGMDSNKKQLALIDLGSSLEGVSNLVQFMQQNGKQFDDKIADIVSGWIMSDYSSFEGDTLSAIQALSNPGQFAQPQFAQVWAALSVQLMLNGDFDTFQAYFQVDAVFPQFAFWFSCYFSRPLPNQYEQHVAAKSQFNSSLGADFIGKIVSCIGENKGGWEALIKTCKWFPVDWFGEQQAALLEIAQQSAVNLKHFIKLYSEVIKMNNELLDLEFLQSLITFDVSAMEVDAVQYSNILSVQSELFKTAAIIHLAQVEEGSEEAGTTSETFIQYATYFFDDDKKSYAVKEVTENVSAVLYRIELVALNQHAETIAGLILNRIMQLISPEEDENYQIDFALVSPLIARLSTLYRIFHQKNVKQSQEFLYAQSTENSENMYAITSIQALVNEIVGKSAEINDVFIEMFEPFAAYFQEQPDEITNQNIQIYYFAIKFICAQYTNESIQQYVAAAYTILLNAYLSQEDWHVAAGKPNLHKKEIGKLITDICALHEEIEIDPDHIIHLMGQKNADDTKLAAALFSNLAFENQSQCIDAILGSGDIELNDKLTFIPLASTFNDADNMEKIAQFLMGIAEQITDTRLNQLWIGAFKAIPSRALVEFIQQIMERVGTSLIAAQQFFELLLKAYSTSSNVNQNRSNYEGEAILEYASQFLSQEYMAQNLPVFKDLFYSAIQNSRHYRTESPQFKRSVLALIKSGLSFFENQKATLSELGLTDEFNSFLTQSILNDRCSSPEVCRIICKTIAKLWGFGKQQNTMSDEEKEAAAAQNVYLFEQTWNYIFAENFDPNEESWILAYQEMFTQQINCIMWFLKNQATAHDSMGQKAQLAEYFDSALLEKMKFLPARAPAFVEFYKEKILDVVSFSQNTAGTYLLKTQFTSKGIPILSLYLNQYRFDE
jgi:hypothetical protein